MSPASITEGGGRIIADDAPSGEWCGRGLPLVEPLAASWEIQHPPEGRKAVAWVLELAH